MNPSLNQPLDFDHKIASYLVEGKMRKLDLESFLAADINAEAVIGLMEEVGFTDKISLK